MTLSEAKQVILKPQADYVIDIKISADCSWFVIPQHEWD
jgi:hypothetical protein